MKKIIEAFCLAMVALTLHACHEAKSSPRIIRDEEIPVRVMQLNQRLAQQTIQASGQFTTEDETILSFKTGGIINEVQVKEGDAVRKGQLVATLHLTEINAQVQQVKFNYEKALRDYNRYSNLYRDSVATLEQLQNTKTALDIAQQQLNTVRFNQSYSEIRATADGYVLKKLANAGQMVNPGDPVLQTNGAHQTAWILKVAVSDIEWSVIKTGNIAKVETDALPNHLVEGVVSKKTEGIDPATGTFTINILLKENITASIATGLFGKAVIYPSAQVAAWSIPYDALLDGDAGDAFVYATNDYKTATKVKVKVGSIDKGDVAIISGLERAKALITSGSAYLKEGSSIKITQ
jgi:RND family efflux transporter MFP subunit